MGVEEFQRSMGIMYMWRSGSERQNIRLTQLLITQDNKVRGLRHSPKFCGCFGNSLKTPRLWRGEFPKLLKETHWYFTMPMHQ